MKLIDMLPVICFTAFVLWLLSTVMDGPLLSAVGITDATSFFLPVHIASLYLIGLFCPRPLFRRFAPAGCILSAALTLMLAWAGPSLGRYILIILGASGAVVTIAAGAALRSSPAPLMGAAWGLAIANLLFMPLGIWPGGEAWRFAAVAAPLAILPVMLRRVPDPVPASDPVSLWHYLPFIAVFQIVSGLMYAFMMPAYHQSALLPGVELLFYIAAVFAASYMALKNRDLALVCGVVAGMAGFALLQYTPTPLKVNLSMFAMQAAAGFIDLIMIAIMLASPRPVRAFGIGSATLCAGILGGKIIGHYFADFSEIIAFGGNLVLNISILVLYFVGRHHYLVQARARAAAAGALRFETVSDAVPPGPPAAVATVNDVSTGPDEAPAPQEEDAENMLPSHLRLLLSDREYHVLKRALAGRTYRETAHELAISESSVKTYMGRIYEKMGVRGKKGLFEMLRKNP